MDQPKENSLPKKRSRLREWAAELRAEVKAVSRAARDPRTPRFARILAIAVAAYAASPIDLIPDFIPVLGVVDDLIILPLGIALVLTLIPKDVLAEHRAAAASEEDVGLKSAGIAIVVIGWLLLLVLLAALTKRWWWR
jgi:uncharacterized membrane protein YkvA (DUF1232 family)